MQKAQQEQDDRRRMRLEREQRQKDAFHGKVVKEEVTPDGHRIIVFQYDDEVRIITLPPLSAVEAE